MVDRGFGLNTGRDVGLNGQGRQAVPPADEGSSWPYSIAATCTKGTVRPFGSGICNVPETVERHSFLLGSPHHHVDQVNAVANLRDRDAGNDDPRAPGPGSRAEISTVSLDPDRP